MTSENRYHLGVAIPPEVVTMEPGHVNGQMAACVLADTGEWNLGDELVPQAEVSAAGGRWFNCRDCLATLDPRRHTTPPEGADDGS